MSDIFLSYASEDRTNIEKLAHALENHGWSVWWDRSIPTGTNYARVIEAALDEARCVIVVWSKISVKSDWVLAEADEARSQGKLFPLNIDGSKPPLVYRNLQTADFSHWSSATTDLIFKRLMTDIRQHIGEPIPKQEFDSEVNEQTGNSSDKLIQAVSSEPVAISNSEPTKFKSVENTGLKVEENHHDKEVLAVKVEHSSEKQKITTKPSNIPVSSLNSLANQTFEKYVSIYIKILCFLDFNLPRNLNRKHIPPPKATEMSNIQKTSENKVSKKIKIKPAPISHSKQAALIEKNPKHVKWIAAISAIVLLSILIGSAQLLQQKKQQNNYAAQSPSNNDSNKLQVGIGISNPPVQKITKTIIEPEMVDIPKGCFQMGSPTSDKNHQADENLHKVCVESFRMGKYEVSFEEYDQFCNATGCQKPDDSGWGRGTQPVINVSWEEATFYAQWLAFKTAKSYRLPTEAEWEYAARGNKQPQTRYPWGDKIGNIKANCVGCGSQWDNKKTAPVGSFTANDFGLFDAVGNVWEWTCSVYKADYDGSENKCAEKRVYRPRVIRGGSWRSGPWSSRSASRYRYNPDTGFNLIGFRLALN